MRRLLAAGCVLLLAGCGGLSEADAKACENGHKLIRYALSMTAVAPEEVVGETARAVGSRLTPVVAAANDAGVKKALKDVESTMAEFRPTPATSAGDTFAEQWLAKTESDRLRQENVKKLDTTLRRQGNALKEACGT
ncbi:hypothetical protein [Herbidospora cretacea]|uniref:hypothetical protein n=1 Tax=Herbidospora cretacea TaxID=28444 RepID=UPI0007732F95|nr:hypothetical protein [Herbidospora cretacea]